MPLVPGAPAELPVRLVSTGHRFAAGHRLRIAVSSSYWPWVWPHGIAATVTIDPAASTRDAAGLDPVDRRRGALRRARAVRRRSRSSASRRPTRCRSARVTHDVETGEWTLDVDPGYGGGRVYPDGLVFTEDARETYRIRQDDPTSARGRVALGDRADEAGVGRAARDDVRGHRRRRGLPRRQHRARVGARRRTRRTRGARRRADVRRRRPRTSASVGVTPRGRRRHGSGSGRRSGAR